MKEIALPTTDFAENTVVNFPHQQSGVFYHLLQQSIVLHLICFSIQLSCTFLIMSNHLSFFIYIFQLQ